MVSFLFVVLFDGPDHLLVRLHNKSAHVVAYFAAIDLAGVASSLQIEFRAAADRADLLDLFRLHDCFMNSLRS